MFGNRSRKIWILLTALAAALCLASAAGAENAAAAGWLAQQESMYDLSQADPQLTWRNGTDKVNGVEEADSLTLMFFGGENPLPRDTDTLMYYNLPRDTAPADLSALQAETVDCEYDEGNNRLVFRWKSGRSGSNAFSVTIPVKKREPYYTVNHILREADGNERLYRSEAKPFVSGVLIRETPIEIDGYEGENAPYETEKRSDYDDVVTFYYHRMSLHYQVDYLAVDGTVLRPRSTFTGVWGEELAPSQEIGGYRFVYCDQGDLPLLLTQDNQYISLRYASETANWMPTERQTAGEAAAAASDSYLVRHVVPGEYTYNGQEIVLKTSAGMAGNPARETYEHFDDKYYCDESRTVISEAGVTFYYRPVQLSVKLNYFEGYMGENGPVRREGADAPIREAQTLALWYGQDYNLNDVIEKHFTSGGTEYTFIGTDNVNRDLMYHGGEENRIYNLYYAGAVSQVAPTSYRVTWKNYDGMVLETDQGVAAGSSPSYNSITPIRPADEASVYEFSGWEPAPAAVNADVEYTAAFTAVPRQYSVRFVNEDGSELRADTLAYGVMPEAEAPAKESTAEFVYRFAGWEPELAPVTGDAVYRSVYTAERRQYTVRFTDDLGNALASVPVLYGTKAEDIPLPEAPAKAPTEETVFRFTGWEPALQDVTGDAEYKAVFAAEKRTYTITWTDGNGGLLDTQTLAYGDMPEHEALTRADTEEYHYTFTGWEPEITPAAGDMTYKAVFEAEKRKYPITWQNEDGSLLETTEAEYGSMPSHEAPEKEPTEKNSYVFHKWQPALKTVTGPATYKAVFKSEQRRYTVRFLKGEGEEISSETYPYGTSARRVKVPETPVREPTEEHTYTFKGWEPKVEDVRKDADYTAVFEENRRTYRITWLKDDGGVLEVTEVPYGDMPAAPDPVKEDTAEKHFDFAGWEPEVKEVTGEAVYQAVYTETTREYAVRFVDEDGTELLSSVYAYNTPAEEIKQPEAPVREDTAEFTYAFAGWQPALENVTKDTVYQVAYTAQKRNYTVRFLKGEGEEISSEAYPYGTAARQIRVPENPVREATAEFSYTFKGWEPEVQDVRKDADYTAVFEENRRTYRITWLKDDGSVLEVTEVPYGDMPAAPSPVKEDTAEKHFDFAGWEPEVTEVTGEAVYQAVYTETIRQYAVRFVDEDGTELLSTAYAYNTPAEEIILPEAPVREDTAEFTYAFAGWTPALENVTKDAVYQAAYTTEKRSYTVRFTDENGETLAETICEYGTPAGEIKGPAVPAKEPTAEFSWTFTGWEPAVTDVTGDAVYQAVFTPVRNVYQITWLWDDGSRMDTTEAAYGEMPVHSEPGKPATEEASYTFSGWTPEIVPVTGEAVYQAVFEEKIREYTLRFVDENGGEVASLTLPYGTEPEGIEAPEGPEKAPTNRYAFLFTGWKPSLARVTRDATYEPVYQRQDRLYTVRFVDDDDTELLTERYPYDTGANRIKAPENPQKEATETVIYTFAGWDRPLTRVREDATYKATYREQTRLYTVRFLDDEGGELASAACEYGADSPAAPENPEKAATEEYSFRFTGWEPEIAETVTADAAYRAVFEPVKRSYTVRFVNDDGEEIASGTYEYGTEAEAIEVPEAPVKENTAEFAYAFAGWEPALSPVTADAVYQAAYSAEKRSYTVRFLNGTGEEMTTAVYEYGTAAGQIQQPEPEAEILTDEYRYTFAAWQPEVADVTGDADYQAAYRAEKRTYPVRFVNENGEEISAAAYEYGTSAEAIEQPAAPEKAPSTEEIYVFAGWEPAPAEVTGEAVYHPVYEAKPRPYTIRFLGEDGEVVSEKAYPYGTAAEAILLPEKLPEKAATAEFSYTFTGWEPELAAVTGDADYMALFDSEVNRYPVHWLNDDGSEIETVNAEYGATPEHAAPVKEPTAETAYTFAGWDPAVAPVTGEASYRAVFSEETRTYPQRFVDEEGNELAQVVCAYGTPAGEIPGPAVPVKAPTEAETFTFSHWEPALADVTGEATYQAVFTAQPRQYTIRFMNDSGRELSSASYAYGTAAEEIERPEEPEKAATDENVYHFAGWEPEVAEVTGDAVYKARFDAEKRKYQITWLDEDGRVIEKTEAEYGATAAHAAPAKDASAEFTYTFVRWKPNPKKVTEDAAYQAVYEKNTRKYRVRFLGEDGKTLKENTYRYGAEIRRQDIPRDPVKADTEEFSYRFTGWEPKIGRVTGDTDYKPAFEETRREYPVRFVNDDGSGIDAKLYPYGTAAAEILMPEAPEKAATAEFTYSFIGWEPALTEVTGEAIYRAMYSAERNSYSITWQQDDGTAVDTVTAEYGAEVSHEPLTKEASAEFTYTFTGWTPAVTEVRGDAIYTAVYEQTRRSYTVTWKNEQGETLAEQTLEYGVTPAMEAPEKAETETEAYEFAGWNPAPAPVTGDIEYTAAYRTIRKITIEADSESFEYDGKPHNASGAHLVSGALQEGDVLSVMVLGSVTHAGEPAESTVNGETLQVIRGEEDVTAEYRFTLLPGQLTVTPRKLTVTTGSAEKVYDGKALTDGTGENEGKAELEGLAEGDTVAVITTGQITEVGSVSNDFTLAWGETRPEDYEVISQAGVLTVAENPAAIVIRAESATKVYDGKALTQPEAAVTGLPEGFTAAAETEGSQTDAGTGTNRITGWRILNAAGEDRSACFTGVATEEGTLTVTPAPLTINTESLTKAYDGIPLSGGAASAIGLAEGESVTLTLTGSLTEIGMAENTCEVTWDGAKETNYTLETHFGTLMLEPSMAEVILRAGSAEKEYDGKPLTTQEILWEGLPEGFTAEGTVTGALTRAGTIQSALADDYRILDVEGEDRTEYFGNILLEHGTLTVHPRKLIITTGSAEKKYDGDPLWNDEITVEGLVKGESVTLRTNGSQTQKGTSLNTYLIMWSRARAANYVIEEHLGELTVK